MNMTLKVLAAIALVAVTIAAGIFVIKTMTAPNNPPGKPTVVTTPKGGATGTDIAEIPTKQAERSKPKFSETIVVKEDDPLQPKYVPVNQPAFLQNIRAEGKTYHSRVMGKVEGQASKKDWGIRGSAYFTYIYGVESIGKITKNDGVTIIEERTFGKVIEDVVVSRYFVGFELPQCIQEGLNCLCAFVGEAIDVHGGGNGKTGAQVGLEIGKSVNKIINNVKIPFNDAMFNKLRSEKMLSEALNPQRVKNEMMMFTKLKGGRILEGKKVKIIFKDGQGITSITPIGCQLSEQEVDVIKRTNYVMDHYLFPDQQVTVGSKWYVNGDVFSGFLDPRLHGKVGGKVSVERIPDFIDAKREVAKRLRLVNGHISFTDNSTAGQAITGQLSGIKGVCRMPEKYGVITTAEMSGYMIYKNVSTDHLLFDAEITVAPRFEISYECSVE